MRYRVLATALRRLAAVLVVRALVTVRSNDPDYFPPDFDALFLQGRASTFVGSHRPAFYVHILSSPAVLPNGLFLVAAPPRRRRDRLHRALGRVQVAVLLALVLPSSGHVPARVGGLARGPEFHCTGRGDRDLCGPRRRPRAPAPLRPAPAPGPEATVIVNARSVRHRAYARAGLRRAVEGPHEKVEPAVAANGPGAHAD